MHPQELGIYLQSLLSKNDHQTFFPFVKQIPLIYLLVFRPKNFRAALALCPSHLGSPQSGQDQVYHIFSICITNTEKMLNEHLWTINFKKMRIFLGCAQALKNGATKIFLLSCRLLRYIFEFYIMSHVYLVIVICKFVCRQYDK